MAITATAVGRATAELTGSDTTDYGNDLDMHNVLGGRVGVTGVITKGSSDEVTVRFHAGNSANPTNIIYALAGAGVVSTGDGTITAGLNELSVVVTGSSLTFYVEIPVSARYFRASATAGGTATSSDAVFTYHYLDYQTVADTDGANRIS